MHLIQSCSPLSCELSDFLKVTRNLWRSLGLGFWHLNSYPLGWATEPTSVSAPHLPAWILFQNILKLFFFHFLKNQFCSRKVRSGSFTLTALLMHVCLLSLPCSSWENNIISNEWHSMGGFQLCLRRPATLLVDKWYWRAALAVWILGASPFPLISSETETLPKPNLWPWKQWPGGGHVTASPAAFPVCSPEVPSLPVPLHPYYPVRWYITPLVHMKLITTSCKTTTSTDEQ